MEVLASAERTLTQLDHARLTNLVFWHKRAQPDLSSPWLDERLLDEATVVPWRMVPPGTITMRSKLLLEHHGDGERCRVTLCYPRDADRQSGQVSVLSPMGWSLLGQQVGATVEWTAATGETRAADILEIVFQPEASGVIAK